MTKEEEKTELYDQAETYGGGQENFMRASRNRHGQIASSALRGYLAYIDDVSIGWCKANFPAALLNQGVTRAKAEGYAVVEGFAFNRAERYEWDFTGPARLYEKLGFTAIIRKDGNVIMRSELK